MTAHLKSKSLTPDDLSNLVGQELGVSSWVEVEQAQIDAFADVTGDHQFIHVDPKRAAETPFGGTIAHGFFDPVASIGHGAGGAAEN